MAASSSLQEYLKRYISEDNPNKKRKSKKKKSTNSRYVGMKIIDTDIDISTFCQTQVSDQAEVDLADDVGDDAPTVAEVFDEAAALAEAAKWKAISTPRETTRNGVLEHEERTYSDEPAPRRQRHDSDESPKRRQRHDSDESPPRRQRHDSDESPPRRQRHDSDESPPRKQRHDSDESPPRRQRHDSDESPPRRQRHDSDESPPRKQRHDSDESPPRRQRHDSDKSPPRRQRHDSDEAPSRRQRHDSDESPPRRQRHDSDESPPRRQRDTLTIEKMQDSKIPKKTKDTHMLSGSKAGLQTATIMKEENKAAKLRENKLFSTLTDSVSGKHAGTVFRDRKTGNIRDLSKEKQRKDKEKVVSAEQQKIYETWKGGVKQNEMQESAIADYLHESEKPLARYKDDTDLDEMLRHQDREGDPMAQFMSNKRRKDKSDVSSSAEKPKYRGPWDPNRYGIPPGYRWDGIDRSNGYEKELQLKQSEKKARQDEAYKWSVEDM